MATWGPGYAQLINGTGGFAGSGRTFSDTAGVARVRPLGLGSDSGAGGLFCVLALGAVLALSSLVAAPRYRILAALAGIATVAGVATSEGRGVIVAGVMTLLVYAFMTLTSQRRLAGLAGFAVAGVVGYFVVSALVASAGTDAFRYQGLGVSKIIATTTQSGRPNQFRAIGDNIANYPLGAGLGTAGPATGSAGGSELAGKVNAESEFSFLIVEAGLPGMVAVVGFTLMLFWLALTRCRREPDAEVRALLAAVTSPIAGILITYYSGPGTAGVPDAPYIWFVGGAISYWLVKVPRDRGAGSIAFADRDHYPPGTARIAR